MKHTHTQKTFTESILFGAGTEIGRVGTFTDLTLRTKLVNLKPKNVSLCDFDTIDNLSVFL